MTALNHRLRESSLHEPSSDVTRKIALKMPVSTKVRYYEYICEKISLVNVSQS
jgi:hypothetical protein